MEIKLEPLELARSAFKVFCLVMGQAEDWDRASLERQQPWLLVGNQAGGLLERLEGNSFAHCGYELMRLHLAPEERPGALTVWNTLPARARLAWEAVARHLATLLDSDEVTSLEEAEALWPAWAEKASAKRKEVERAGA